MRRDTQPIFDGVLVFSIAAVAILILVNLAAALFSPNRAEPQLELGKSEIDFGRLEEGEKRTAKFSIFNSGKGLLTVDRVEPG